ncbi:MAG: peptide-methionine (S)-S-oxide reductase MsrA [Acholeplasmatales bacterium]|nr:peptide-methionine (S)-S-oxide reductase MsrA [Acholeplasmatales bacterium]
MFKIYKNILELRKENNITFDFEINEFSNQKFIFKFYNEDDELFVIKDDVLYLLGDDTLAKEAAETLANYNLKFENIFSEDDLAKAFLDEYIKIFNGSYQKLDGLFKYSEGNIKTILLAGGCFWCMAHPYYEYDGILKVLSGFVGDDDIINPTYEEVKHGNAKFRETILLRYDSNIINHEQILKIYFSNIDPFDPDGQFIDKGFNYTTAIFTDDKNVKKYAKYYLEKLEEKYKMKPLVKLLKDKVFYMAEEYHQDYGIKNPEKMVCELKESGRLNRRRYEIDD